MYEPQIKARRRCRKPDPSQKRFRRTARSGRDARALGRAALLLKALGNGQRLRILCLLVERERSVGEINQGIALSPSALSQHLARLREEGLVTTRRAAQTIFYSLADGPVRRSSRRCTASTAGPVRAHRAGTRRRLGGNSDPVAGIELKSRPEFAHP
jgi:DNA-binding transcriptional ArsR family regulator